MKILITGDSIYPDTMGGSHRTIYDTCFCLAKEGHDVVALIPTKNETLPRDEKKDGFRIIRYLRNRRNKLADLNSYIDRAKDSFEELSKNWVPDIVHGNWPLPVFGIYKSKSAKGIPLVFTFHGPWPEEYLYEISGKLKIIKPILFKYFRNIERSVLKRANQIIVASNFMKELGMNIYGKDVFGNAVIVTPGVDSSRYTKYKNISKSELRDELNLPKDKKIIFTARRLYRRMGLENLIQSMTYIKKERSDVLILIAGKGILKDELEKLIIAEKAEDDIKLLGFVSEEDLPKYFRTADLSVLPTTALEGFGLTIIESNLTGTPILGTPVGAIPEAINMFKGSSLTNGAAPQDLASGILRALDGETNEASDMEYFDRERMAKQVEKIYYGLLSKK